MELGRDRFIEQFAIAFQVHCLRSWSTRFKSPPAHLATCFYERVKINGGRMSLSRADFAGLAAPVIDAVHRSTPKGQRPDADRLAGLLYDTLDATGVEVTIEPFVMVTVARGLSLFQQVKPHPEEAAKRPSRRMGLDDDL